MEGHSILYIFFYIHKNKDHLSCLNETKLILPASFLCYVESGSSFVVGSFDV